ncbi:unnamed protein product [Sphenostylis stenocarpa]|uniref:Uncharacterized protein n=1 Tax=Sphenostylis stenocarpa TaxID=92480 RepID=A0AA86RRJ1_9FABA|nr:unnamed protein product [Sphenostylis stenocarpa]
MGVKNDFLDGPSENWITKPIGRRLMQVTNFQPQMPPIHCIINATTKASTEEHKVTTETFREEPAPVSICDVGAIADSCATVLVTWWEITFWPAEVHDLTWQRCKEADMKVTCAVLIVAASMSAAVAATEVSAPAPGPDSGATMPLVGSLVGASVLSFFALFH